MTLRALAENGLIFLLQFVVAFQIMRIELSVMVFFLNQKMLEHFITELKTQSKSGRHAHETFSLASHQLFLYTGSILFYLCLSFLDSFIFLVRIL